MSSSYGVLADLLHSAPKAISPFSPMYIASMLGLAQIIIPGTSGCHHAALGHVTEEQRNSWPGSIRIKDQQEN